MRAAAILAVVIAAMAPARADAMEWFGRVWRVFGLGGGEHAAADAGSRPDRLSQTQASRGVREALSLGATRATTRLGLIGFGGAIGLPEALSEAQEQLRGVGRSGRLDALEERLDRAAQRLMPAADAHLQAEIDRLVLPDALAVVRGGEEAATLFLRVRTEAGLVAALTGPAQAALSEVGATRMVEEAASAAGLGGRAEDWSLRLARHLAERSAAAVYDALALEERAIRATPEGHEVVRRAFAADAT